MNRVTTMVGAGLMALGLAFAGCSRDDGLAERVDAFCNDVEVNLELWAGNPESYHRHPFRLSLRRDVSFCIRARDIDDAWIEDATQKVAIHADALVSPLPTNKEHLQAILAIYKTALKHPLKD